MQSRLYVLEWKLRHSLKDCFRINSEMEQAMVIEKLKSRSTNYKAPQYAIFFGTLFLHPFWIKISMWSLFSRLSSIYIQNCISIFSPAPVILRRILFSTSSVSLEKKLAMGSYTNITFLTWHNTGLWIRLQLVHEVTVQAQTEILRQYISTRTAQGTSSRYMWPFVAVMKELCSY
jgi:hypothetical protein